MKAQELRIGNWIKQPSRMGKVYEVWQEAARIEGHYNAYDYEHTKAIPLTEEWLLRFGFTPNPYNDTYEKGDFYIDCDKTKGSLKLWVTNYRVDLEHVHQLQNLFFALTGEELELKKGVWVFCNGSGL